MALTKKSPWTWVASLYVAEGLPYVAVMTIAGIMYKRFGVSNTDIALFTSWLSLPWVIKPFWSPIVDIIGTKRLWVLTMQWCLAIGFAAISFALPGPLYFQISLAAFFIIAFLSATHDIAADGFYMLGLSQSQQSFFVGIRSTFYRIALVVGQGPVVIAAGLLETKLGNIPMAWTWVFIILSATFALLALYHSYVLPLPEKEMDRCTRKSIGFVVNEFVETFCEFFKKRDIVIALAFMLLYKLPEAQLIRLISPFLLDSESYRASSILLQRLLQWCQHKWYQLFLSGWLLW